MCSFTPPVWKLGKFVSQKSPPVAPQPCCRVSPGFSLICQDLTSSCCLASVSLLVWSARQLFLSLVASSIANVQAYCSLRCKHSHLVYEKTKIHYTKYMNTITMEYLIILIRIIINILFKMNRPMDIWQTHTYLLYKIIYIYNCFYYYYNASIDSDGSKMHFTKIWFFSSGDLNTKYRRRFI